MAWISNFVGYAGLGLSLLLMGLLIWGPFRRYYPLFILVAVSFAGNLAQGWANQTYHGKGDKYFQVFWTAELLNNLAFLVLIIGITALALADSPIRSQVIKFVGIVLAAALILPFVLYGGPIVQVTNTFKESTSRNVSTSQMLNFGGAVMSLGLWTALLTGKRREAQFLTVITGLGVWVSGTAFALGVYHFTAPRSDLRMVANFFTSITQLAAVTIWCWAFWPKKKIDPPPPPTPAASDGAESSALR